MAEVAEAAQDSAEEVAEAAAVSEEDVEASAVAAEAALSKDPQTT